MSEKNFAVMPSVSIPRSKFDRISTHKTAVRLGDVVPLYVDEVLPGDTRSIDFGSLIRMSTPIAPIMDDIYYELFAFFVPNRLTWEHWKEFCGENTQGAGLSSEEYFIPTVSVPLGDIAEKPYSIGAYMGLPGIAGSKTGINVSELPLRAYYLICNRWFRNQNVEAPIPVDISDDTEVNFGYYNDCWVASKKADYFTKSLPYAQKGEPVMLPLGSTAPIIAGEYHGVGGNVQFGSSSATGSAHLKNGVLSFDVNDQTSAGLTPVGGTNLVADLSNATAATINQLREAYALQLTLEKDANYGTRYWEVLFGHFGVTSPDATLQDPEFLGHAKININIEQVLQTTGYESDTASQLGAIGANSVTGDRGSLFTKSFVEHGYIFILGVARHRETYGQGVNRMFTRQRRFDFYWPTFAHLGAQAVLNKEIYANGSNDDDGIFGYQEAWAEYRYKPNLATSIMNPAMPNSLDFWTLTSKFDELPTLSTSFTKVNRNSLQRALTTGDMGPDFICDFVFKDTAVRPMPLYSIPGLLGEL